MKKYNMPKMEISLFDVEVVSTSENPQSTAMVNFTNEYNQALANNGIAKTISWDKLKFTY